MFNCGKMEHIFTFSEDGKRYLPQFASKEAEEALKSGKFFIKVDGSCGALVREKEGWTLYNRFDDTKNKFEGKAPDGFLPLPKGENQDKYQGHSYYLRKLRRPQLGEKLKGEDKFVSKLYAHLDNLEKRGVLADLPDFSSIELVGKNFNGTNLGPGQGENGITLHSAQILDISRELGSERPKNAELWLEWLVSFLEKEGVLLHEGLVVENNGRWWKIRSEYICKGKKRYLPPILL